LTAAALGDNPLMCLEDDTNIRVEAEVKLNCTHHKSILTAEEIGEKEASKKDQMLTILQDVLSPSGNDDDDDDDDDCNRPSLPSVSFVPAAAVDDDDSV